MKDENSETEGNKEKYFHNANGIIGYQRNPIQSDKKNKYNDCSI